MIRSVSALLTLCAIGAMATPVRAYRTASDLPELAGTSWVGWDGDTVDYYVSATDYPGASFAAVTEAVSLGVASWSGTECGFDQFRYRGTDGPPTPGDGQNTIGWHQSNWSQAGFPPSAMAVTDVLYQEFAPGDWRITEADVLINGYDFRWVPGSTSGDSELRSIQAVVAHEAGHMLGILHPCEPGGFGGVPGCGSDPAHEDAAMYPLYTGRSEVFLSEDDTAALCHQFAPIACDEPCAGETICRLGECVPDTIHHVDLCGSDADCDSFSICLSGLCRPFVGQIGDPCSGAADCSSGICADDHCAEECAPAGVCPFPYQCSDPGAASALCEASLGEFGDACELGASCVSGLCLSGVTGGTLCTRPCPAGSEAACPPAYECLEVDDQAVCSPERPGRGCSASGPPSPASSSFPIFVLMTLLIFAHRKRVSA